MATADDESEIDRRPMWWYFKSPALLVVQLAAVWVASGVVTRAQTTSSQSLPAQTTTPETAGLYVGIIVAESIVLDEFGPFTGGTEIPHGAHSPAALLPLAAGVVVLVTVVSGQLVWSAIADKTEGKDGR
jgi:hypothetical protein